MHLLVSQVDGLSVASALSGVKGMTLPAPVYRGAVHCLYSIARDEGIKHGLYRGEGIDVTFIWSGVL